jgi:benzil reductase ((S)-benzoin forming)
MNILITGTSSGLGLGLANEFGKAGYTIYGLNRTKTQNPYVKHIQCNLSYLEGIEPALNTITNVDCFDYVFLNAGILGRLSVTNDLSIEEYNRIFNINLLSNKIIIDFLIKNNKSKNIIGISSGAALKAYFGWSLYCCSKAAFKQLLETYSQEYKDIHFLSLAPGIIKTKMQDYIYKQDEKQIPSISKFKNMYDKMDTSDVVAKKIFKNIDKLNTLPSGSYFDIREF